MYPANMHFQSLRIASASVSPIPTGVEHPIVLKKQGFGFIVLPVKESIHAYSGSSSHPDTKLEAGEMLIIKGETPVVVYNRITAAEINSQVLADLSCPRRLTEIEGTANRIINDDNKTASNSLHPNSSNGNHFYLNEIRATPLPKSEPAALIISVEICEIVRGGLGTAIPDILHFSYNHESSQFVITIAEQLAQLSHKSESLKNACTDRLTELLLLEAMDFFLRKSPFKNRLMKGIGDRSLSKALKAIHSNPEHNWSVLELASIANMSRSQFAEKFKLTLNETPLNFVRQCRIQKAKILLTESKASIEQIAQDCGYASQSSFIKSFTSLVGTSPGEWRTRSIDQNQRL